MTDAKKQRLYPLQLCEQRCALPGFSVRQTLVKVSKVNWMFLSCNLVLLAAAGYFIWQQRPQAEVQDVAASDDPAAMGAANSFTAPQIITVTNDFRWRQLESEEYRTYIDRLRSIGCPEQTIRDIVISDLDKLMAPRLEALNGRRPDLQFWHSEEEELANERDNREISRAQRQIDNEKRAVIEELLGVDLVRERLRSNGGHDYYERRLSFLPEDRRSDVRKVLEKYDDLEQRLLEKEWIDAEPLTAQDYAELRRLRNQQQTELAGLLNPGEREQYELWMSDTANTVRQATYGMDISREEFLVVYNARKAFDQQWASRDPNLMDDGTRARMELARQQMEADLQRQLGAERFAEYKRGEDPDFHQLAKTATQFKLPKETAKRVYDVKRALEDVRQTLDQDTALTPDQKAAALAAMQQETQRAVRQLLGDRAFRYYLRAGEAGWLQ
jgi:hypothetical protein